MDTTCRCGEERGRITSLNLLAILIYHSPGATGPLSCNDKSLCHGYLVSAMDPVVLIVPSSFPAGWNLFWCMGLFFGTCRNVFLFPCFEFHEIPVNPFFHTIEVPLNGSMTLSCINHLFQFCVPWKPLEGNSQVISVSKAGVKRPLCQYQPHVTPPVTDL